MKPDGKGVDEVWRGLSLETHWTTPIYHDGRLYAFSGRNEPDARWRCIDFKTGKLLWETVMVNSGNATPITYEVNGKQFVVIAAFGGYDGARPNATKSTPPGGAFIAFALP